MGTLLLSKEILTPANWDELKRFKIKSLIQAHNSSDESVEAIIAMLSDDLSEKTLSNFPNLKVIANYAVGFNNIDIDYCQKNNIAVGNTPNALTDATSDIAITLLFTCLRNLKPAQENARNGEWKTWEPKGFLGHDLKGKTVGILGMGRIGSDFARKLHLGWNCKIIYHNRNKKTDLDFPAELVSKDELQSHSDILSLHSPYVKELENFIDYDFLRGMKKSSILINTSRGQLVNEADLFKALKENQIFSCGVDVTNPEPMDPKNPLIGLDNFISLPHIGSATFKAREEMSFMTVENILTGHRTGKCKYSAI